MIMKTARKTGGASTRAGMAENAASATDRVLGSAPARHRRGEGHPSQWAVALTAAFLTLSFSLCGREASAQSFTAASNLDTPRERHAAVQLSDGRVLVTGGYNTIGTFLKSTVVYPAAGGPLVGGPDLPVGDIDLSLTILKNGKVLAVGGYATPSSIVDLYDPSGGGSWTADTPLPLDSAVGNQGRSGHGATLLPDGRVFVVGGSNVAGEDFNSAALYVPGTTVGSWLSAPTPPNPRGGTITTTLLRDGSVLVVGGRSSVAAVAAVDRYVPDAGAGSWATTGPLATGRQAHTATLLPNGKVLVAGGGLRSAELYDPSTGLWSPTGSLATTRAYHTATLLPCGLVLVTGGEEPNGHVISSAELYNPATGTWSSAGSQLSPRLFHTATLTATGQVLLTGGDGTGSGINALLSAELYAPMELVTDPSFESSSLSFSYFRGPGDANWTLGQWNAEAATIVTTAAPGVAPVTPFAGTEMLQIHQSGDSVSNVGQIIDVTGQVVGDSVVTCGFRVNAKTNSAAKVQSFLVSGTGVTPGTGPFPTPPPNGILLNQTAAVLGPLMSLATTATTLGWTQYSVSRTVPAGTNVLWFDIEVPNAGAPTDGVFVDFGSCCISPVPKMVPALSTWAVMLLGLLLSGLALVVMSRRSRVTNRA